MDLSGYETSEIRLAASKKHKDYGSFKIIGTELTFSNNPGLTREEFEPYILEAIKDDAVNQLNIKAGIERGKVITVAAGQEIAYAFKYEEAQDILAKPEDEALDPADYIMLASELQSHGQALSLRDLARIVIDKAIYTKKALAFIEVRRYAIKDNIEDALTKEEIYQEVRLADFTLPDNL